MSCGRTLLVITIIINIIIIIISSSSSSNSNNDDVSTDPNRISIAGFFGIFRVLLRIPK